MAQLSTTRTKRFRAPVAHEYERTAVIDFNLQRKSKLADAFIASRWRNEVALIMNNFSCEAMLTLVLLGWQPQ